MRTISTKNNTRTLLVKSAIELFKEYGTEKVSVKDICDKAAVTRNAFYYYFESKELLFDAVGDWISEISKERITIVYGDTSYYRHLWEFYHAYLKTQLEMGPDIMNHVCFSRTMKERSDTYSYIDDELAKTMIALIRKGQEAGQILNPSPAENLLWTSYALVRGVNIKWCFQWGEPDLIGETMDSLNDIFLPAEGFALTSADR